MQTTRRSSLLTVLVASFLTFIVLPNLTPAPPLAPVPDVSQREELNLNGTWDMAVTADPAYPPRVSKWDAAAVPVMAQSNAIGGTRFVWYRKSITVPESFRGKRIDLILYGARFNASVYCGGALVGSRLEGYTPFSLELTDRVKPGAAFLLEVRCQDWSAVFKDNYTLPPGADPNGETLRGVPNGKLIAPIGGHFERFGLWDDVVLQARPLARCEDVAIATSVRNDNRLTVTGAIAGRNGLWIEGEVQDEGKTMVILPGRAAGSDGRFNLSAVFAKPRYWSPEDPHRYTLVLSLKEKKDGTLLDQYDERFGFRELWAVGPDFYLNGVKRHLLASSGWPTPRYMSSEEIRNAIADIKSSNAVGFRLHTQPWQRRWLEEADALGLMLVEEGALWCDGGGGYAYADERFWQNVDAHLAAMVRRDRNHPALVMWSIENEILHCGAMGKCPCAEPRLAEAGLKIRALDPTHLITYEADHDPLGAADVIGLHYPREMPDHTDYPNTADWLGTTVTTGTAGGTAGSWNKDFFWDRKKPLYIGEYLWVFQQDYSAGSVFYGDEAYKDAAAYRDKAKADAWVFQTVAYRRAGVSGMCPWTIAEEGGKVDKTSPLFAAQKTAYAPVAIFPREYDTRFFAGEKVKRSFDVFNDGTASLKIEARFTMPGWTPGYAETFSLEPAGHKEITITVPMPGLSPADGVSFSAALFTAGKKINSYETHYRVFDKTQPALPAGRKLLVFDPAQKWPGGLAIHGAVGLKKLDELAGFDPERSILVIGPSAITDGKSEAAVPTIGAKNASAGLFKSFLDRGGRALVLEQDSLAPLWPGIELVDHASTMTFAVSPSDPFAAGLDAGSWKFWRGDHYVSRREINRPARFGAKAVTVSGGGDAVSQAPIVSLPVGRGLVVFCQALAGTKYDTEPAARRFIANALGWLALYRDASATALLVNGDNGAAFKKRLDEIGLAYKEPPAQPQKADADKADLIVLHGGGKNIDALASLLTVRAKPLTVYWHAPEKDSFDKLKSVLGLGNAAVTAATGPVAFADATAPTAGGLLREDLAFQKPLAPSNWYRVIDEDPGVIDRALSISAPGASFRDYQLSAWSLSGELVKATGDGSVAYSTNGKAEDEIETARAGLYQLRLEAWGTPADNGWPVAEVKANGLTIGQVSVTSRDKQIYPFLARLPQGIVKIGVAFINDYYKNGQDRNLSVRMLGISQDPVDANGLTLLTLPPALVEADPKPGLRVIVDCVRWDINENNRVRGLRYAGTLLANLGAAFQAGRPSPDWIGLSFFQPVGTISVFNRTDAQLFFGSGGAVKSTFTCATAGEYTVAVRGYSTPAEGVYGKARVKIDGRTIGEPELASGTAAEFPAGAVRLEAGAHELTVEFTNDLWLGAGKEDRNLYLTGVGFLSEK